MRFEDASMKVYWVPQISDPERPTVAELTAGEELTGVISDLSGWRVQGSTDILDQIAAAIGCQHCGGPLGGSPSGDFCGEDCQVQWHAARSEPLPFEHWGNSYVIDETHVLRDYTEAIRRIVEQAVGVSGFAQVDWGTPSPRNELARVGLPCSHTGGFVDLCRLCEPPGSSVMCIDCSEIRSEDEWEDV